MAGRCLPIQAVMHTLFQIIIIIPIMNLQLMDATNNRSIGAGNTNACPGNCATFIIISL